MATNIKHEVSMTLERERDTERETDRQTKRERERDKHDMLHLFLSC